MNEAQVKQSVEQMERMVHALSSLCAEVLPQSRQYFAVMAEGPLDEIRRLGQDIEVFVDEVLRPLAEAADAAEAAEAAGGVTTT